MDFKKYLDKTGEYGVAELVNHPLVKVNGLPLVKPSEMVVFESGKMGEVFTLNEEQVEVLVFSNDPIRPGSRLTRTDKFLSVPVGMEMLGSTIDPLGNFLNDDSPKKIKEERFIDSTPLGIFHREKVKKPFSTGVALVDTMIPIGCGQRELIIGDRKSGKTSFLLSAVKYQTQLKLAGSGAVVIYAAIGKKKSEIKRLQDYFEKEEIKNNCLMVVSTSEMASSLIQLTPHTAMTIAEYFRDLGEDVLVVLDDLSTHAKYHREIALLARRFPGRDSYPGDIFYAQAKLLERAGNFKHPKKGEVSITCLPVVEILEGELTGYIPTNLMGMTDGHIFFDSNIFFKGRRPAINIPLSVTRVGRQTQSNLEREMSNKLYAFLTEYDKVQNLSHFGAELTEDVKKIMKKGDQIFEFFNQPYTQVLPEDVQLILLGLIWADVLTEGDCNITVSDCREKLNLAYWKKDTVDFFAKLRKVKTLDEFIKNITREKERLISVCRLKDK